jgi:SAM-dependent methyltransferase
MSEEERERWDRRYGDGDYRPRTTPSPFLEEAIGIVPAGRALVVACGMGRNAVRLAEAGFQVEGVDISAVAIEQAEANASARGLEVDWRMADLDDEELPAGRYDLITMIRYVKRPLWPRLVEALAPDGWLLIEHHLDTHLEVGGPQSPDFRLRPGELLEAFGGLRIVRYEELIEPADRPGTSACLARLLACKGNPGW